MSIAFLMEMLIRTLILSHSWILLSLGLPEAAHQNTAFKRVCYFTNWSCDLLVPEAHFCLHDVDASLCSHIVYGFVGINGTSHSLSPSRVDDESRDNFVGRYVLFNDLKKRHPHIKTLLSVGGSLESKNFNAVTSSAMARRKFAANSVDYVRKWGFDGLDIDWEYPGQSGGSKEALSWLVQDIRKADSLVRQRTNSQALLLSIAGPASDHLVDQGFQVDIISMHVDFINIMAYDLQGAWSRITGFNSPLYSRTDDERFHPKHCVEWVVQMWINKGAPPSKLVLGVAGYGQSYTLAPRKTATRTPPLFNIDPVFPLPELTTRPLRAQSNHPAMSAIPVSHGASNRSNSVSSASRTAATMQVSNTTTTISSETPPIPGIGSPAIGPGKPGRLRHLNGQMSYPEICELIRQGAQVVWDQQQRVPFMTLGDLWVGYDDQRSVIEKVKWAVSLNLGGVMFWSLDLDDFTGKYCGRGRYPLLTALSNTVMSLVGRPNIEPHHSAATDVGREATTRHSAALPRRHHWHTEVRDDVVRTGTGRAARQDGAIHVSRGSTTYNRSGPRFPDIPEMRSNGPIFPTGHDRSKQTNFPGSYFENAEQGRAAIRPWKKVVQEGRQQALTTRRYLGNGQSAQRGGQSDVHSPTDQGHSARGKLSPENGWPRTRQNSSMLIAAITSNTNSQNNNDVEYADDNATSSRQRDVNLRRQNRTYDDSNDNAPFKHREKQQQPHGDSIVNGEGHNYNYNNNNYDNNPIYYRGRTVVSDTPSMGRRANGINENSDGILSKTQAKSLGRLKENDLETANRDRGDNTRARFDDRRGEFDDENARNMVPDRSDIEYGKRVDDTPSRRAFDDDRDNGDWRSTTYPYDRRYPKKNRNARRRNINQNPDNNNSNNNNGYATSFDTLSPDPGHTGSSRNNLVQVEGHMNEGDSFGPDRADGHHNSKKGQGPDVIDFEGTRLVILCTEEEEGEREEQKDDSLDEKSSSPHHKPSLPSPKHMASTTPFSPDDHKSENYGMGIDFVDNDYLNDIVNEYDYYIAFIDDELKAQSRTTMAPHDSFTYAKQSIVEGRGTLPGRQKTSLNVKSSIAAGSDGIPQRITIAVPNSGSSNQFVALKATHIYIIFVILFLLLF